MKKNVLTFEYHASITILFLELHNRFAFNIRGGLIYEFSFNDKINGIMLIFVSIFDFYEKIVFVFQKLHYLFGFDVR